MQSKEIEFAEPRIGFVSTRIAGTDGVSLELGKWATVLEEMGIECYYITGESDRPEERTAIIEEAHFNHPAILDISRTAFEMEQRTPELTNHIFEMTRIIRDKLADAIQQLGVNHIIAQNCLTIPMNVPLGLAIVAEIQEMGIGCTAHHHDFYWERDRFLINAVDDFLRYAFPPALPQIQHVCINSLAAEEFSRRTGQSCRIIPNVMDFENPPPRPDDYARTFRGEIGLAENDLLILQPTRVVERKGIEHAIELCHRLDKERAKLVITHKSGDEGEAYRQRLVEFSEIMGVQLVFADEHISDSRGTDTQGRKLFTLHDAFSQADLVAYPSEYEGFGNAFLEAIYFKCPVFCNRYAIYRTDIEPCGFKVALFDGFVTNETVEDVRRILEDASYREAMVVHNYDVGKRFFSYDVLRNEFQIMIRRPQNIYRLLGRNPRFRQRMAGGEDILIGAKV